MSLPATGVWEVQTTGNDNNGGMFDPSVAGAGTDYTYGAGKATFAYTDLVVDAVTNTKVTSATRSFVAADVGNTIQIVSGTGWTTGFYNIRSVASGAATLDRSPAAVATTGGTGTLGGALASPGKAAGVKVAGNDVWVNAGTYSITSASTNISGGCVNDTVGASAANNISWWRGYQTTRGDLGIKPLLQASGISTATLFKASGVFIVVENIAVDGASLTSITGFNLSASAVKFRLCKAANCTNSGISATNVNGIIAFCEATGCSAAGAGISTNFGANIKVFGCVSHDNSVSGISVLSGHLFDCISYNNSGASSHGIDVTPAGRSVVTRCTCYNNGGNGVNLGSSENEVYSVLSYNNGSYGFAASASSELVQLSNCAAGANVSGATNNILTNAVDMVTLTADPFTNAAAGDFSLNNAAGGGAACRAAGIPGVFPGGLTTGYLDIGAAQHQDAGGGGGVALRSPIMANTLIYEE